MTYGNILPEIEEKKPEEEDIGFFDKIGKFLARHEQPKNPNASVDNAHQFNMQTGNYGNNAQGNDYTQSTAANGINLKNGEKEERGTWKFWD